MKDLKQVFSRRKVSAKIVFLRYILFLSFSLCVYSSIINFLKRNEFNRETEVVQSFKLPKAEGRHSNEKDLIYDENEEIQIPHKQYPSDFPVDLVITWVNGSDPEWTKKKERFEKMYNIKSSKLVLRSRFLDIGELKYNLRIITKNLPWIRKIFILTDKQRPSWLKKSWNSKVTIVSHSDIFPKAALPVFNSNNIEFHMHKIPGLAEHFIYLNDDVFISRPSNKSTFFTEEGLPIIPCIIYNWTNHAEIAEKLIKIKYIRNDMGSVQFTLTSQRSYDVFYRRFGIDVDLKSIHGYMTFTKTLIQFMWDAFPKVLNELETHRFRDYSDVNIPHLSLLVAAGCNLGVPLIQEKGKDKKINYMLVIDNNFKNVIQDFDSSKYLSFCLNSGEKTTNNSRMEAIRFLEQFVPDKSPYEK